MYMRHTTVMEFDWKMGFVTNLLPVENGKISQKWPKMGFSNRIISFPKKIQKELSITGK